MSTDTPSTHGSATLTSPSRRFAWVTTLAQMPESQVTTTESYLAPRKELPEVNQRRLPVDDTRRPLGYWDPTELQQPTQYERVLKPKPATTTEDVPPASSQVDEDANLLVIDAASSPSHELAPITADQLPLTSQLAPLDLQVVDPPSTLQLTSQLAPQEVEDEWEEVPVPPQFHELTYIDNYPITPIGTPFWERLEGEPLSAYEAFRMFRDWPFEEGQMREVLSGEQRKTKGLNSQKYHDAAVVSGTAHPLRSRALEELARELDVPFPTLNALAGLYCWRYRALAYDQYRERERDREIKRQAREVEVYHGRLARNLLAKVEEAMDEVEAEELTPQMMLEWMKQGVQLERISHRMDPTKPTPSPVTASDVKEERQEAAYMEALKAARTKEERLALLEAKRLADEALAKQKQGQGGGEINIHNPNGAVQIQVIHTDDWRSS